MKAEAGKHKTTTETKVGKDGERVTKTVEEEWYARIQTNKAIRMSPWDAMKDLARWARDDSKTPNQESEAKEQESGSGDEG